MAELTLFEKSNITANEWVECLMSDLGWTSEVNAYIALRGVLHSLRDSLSQEEAFYLGSKLPLIIRGIYYESYDPSGKPLRMEKTVFLNRVHSYLNYEYFASSDRIIRSVFTLFQEKLVNGDSLKYLLPRELESLWPSPKMRV